MKVAQAIAAIIPVLLVLWYVLARHTSRAEAGVIWTLFALGASSSFAVMLIDFPIYFVAEAKDDIVIHALVVAFPGAGFCEEAGKLLVLVIFGLRLLPRINRMDAIKSAATVSLGFAAVENLVYVTGDDEWGQVAFLRAALSVPGHGALGMIMGYFVGLAIHAASRTWLLWCCALVIPALLHGAFDFPLLVLDDYFKLGLERDDEWAYEFMLAAVVLCEACIAFQCVRRVSAANPINAIGMPLWWPTWAPSQGSVWFGIGTAVTFSGVSTVAASLIATLSTNAAEMLSIPPAIIFSLGVFPTLFGLAMIALGVRLRRIPQAN